MATSNWGNSGQAAVKCAIKPVRSGLLVKWLTNNGRITAFDKKLMPNQNDAPSSTFTMKFHR